MKQYTYEAAEREGWRSYPVRILGRHPSNCHHAPKVLVESKPGGYVTANCSACNKPFSVSEVEFKELPVWVSCPKCCKRMSPRMVPGQGDGNNYGYACQDCELYIWLSHLLPKWEDVRPQGSAHG